MEKKMKKLILSSVFAGLMLSAGMTDVSAACGSSSKSSYGKMAIGAKFSGGYWANVMHQAKGDSSADGIDSDDFGARHLVAMGDTQMSFRSEGGDAGVAFGAFVKLDADAGLLNNSATASKIFRDVYVYGRFANMVEVRFGSQRDAMWSMVGADSIQAGTSGYNGYFGTLLGGASAGNAARKKLWVLDLSHKNDTGYTNALEVRTMPMAGFEAVVNFKPSSAYVGRLGTYGDGTKTKVAGVQNNIVSAAVNYDNTFGDFRVRGSVSGVYGGSDKVGLTDAATSLTYRADAIVSWKSLDVAIGWLDNMSTGFGGVNKEMNAGKAVHGGVAYQLNNVMWKPRIALGAMWGWKNGSADWDDTTNKFAYQDMTLAISPSIDLNIHDGFRWFVEGTFVTLDEKNTSEGSSDKGWNESNLIIGTGFAVKQ